MGKINGEDGKIPTYKQEYKQSVDLFDKSFKEYMQADEPHKKAKFEDVMKKALDIMNQSAQEGLTKEQQKLNDDLHKDYEAYIEKPDADGVNKLQKDVDDIRKSL